MGSFQFPAVMPIDACNREGCTTSALRLARGIDLHVALLSDSPECDRATKAIFEVLASVDLQFQERRCHSDALTTVTASVRTRFIKAQMSLAMIPSADHSQSTRNHSTKLCSCSPLYFFCQHALFPEFPSHSCCWLVSSDRSHRLAAC